MTEGAEILKAFGARVKTLRREKGLSQEKLGFGCNLSQTYISEVEQGKRNVSLINIAGIARELDVSLEELMKGVKEG